MRSRLRKIARIGLRVLRKMWAPLARLASILISILVVISKISDVILKATQWLA